jgi:hypothetical protein
MRRFRWTMAERSQLRSQKLFAVSPGIGRSQNAHCAHDWDAFLIVWNDAGAAAFSCAPPLAVKQNFELKSPKQADIMPPVPLRLDAKICARKYSRAIR